MGQALTRQDPPPPAQAGLTVPPSWPPLHGHPKMSPELQMGKLRLGQGRHWAGSHSGATSHPGLALPHNAALQLPGVFLPLFILNCMGLFPNSSFTTLKKTAVSKCAFFSQRSLLVNVTLLLKTCGLFSNIF